MPVHLMWATLTISMAIMEGLIIILRMRVRVRSTHA
jgi:hypothetical protein